MSGNFAQVNLLAEYLIKPDPYHIYNNDPGAYQAAHSILNFYLSGKILSGQHLYCDNPGKVPSLTMKYALHKYSALLFSHHQKRSLLAQTGSLSFRILL